MTSRLAPLEPPHDPDLAAVIERMPAPLRLFRTIGHNVQVLDRFRSTGAFLLNFGSLDAFEREIVLQRTCARCGSEYEFGVHATVYGERFTPEQLTSLARGSAGDPVWTERERVLIRTADELHDSSTVSDELWSELEAGWSPEQLVELIAVAGFYHLVSFMTNAFAIEPEEWAAPFP